MGYNYIKVLIALIFIHSYSPIFGQNDIRSNARYLFGQKSTTGSPAPKFSDYGFDPMFSGKKNAIGDFRAYFHESSNTTSNIGIFRNSFHSFTPPLLFKIEHLHLENTKLFTGPNIIFYKGIIISLLKKIVDGSAILAITSGKDKLDKIIDFKESGDGILLSAKNKPVFNTVVFVLLILISLLAYLNYRSYRKKITALSLLEEKNQEILLQKEEIQATLNMVEKLNSKLDAQSQALNKSALVAILTHDGKIDYINEKFVGQSGYRLSQIEKKSFSELLSPEYQEIFNREIIPALRDQQIWRGEICHIKNDESKLWVDAVFVPLTDEQDNNYKIYAIQFDITPRIEVEQKLIEKNNNLKQLNQLKNKIFSIVSHDFRSPLKSLAGTLTLFKKGAISPEELKNLSESLLEKVENTSNFLENMLNWSKSQMKGLKISRQPIPVKQVTEEMIVLLKPQADKKQITIKNEAPEGIAVEADLEMIKLVLRNLISNAIKFSFEDKSIIIDAHTSEDSKVVICIKDFGTGIPEKQLDAIFQLENYSTTGTANELGAGLGLILCKEFVKQNNGEIWVESQEGEGSIFCFTLPIA